MFDFVDICRNAQTITTSVVYSSESVNLPDGTCILGSFVQEVLLLLLVLRKFISI